MLGAEDSGGVRDDCLEDNEVLVALVCAGQTRAIYHYEVDHEVFLNGFPLGPMGACCCDLGEGRREIIHYK